VACRMFTTRTVPPGPVAARPLAVGSGDYIQIGQIWPVVCPAGPDPATNQIGGLGADQR
jgi:hypothetical protein